jgi:hypothetical protein
MVQQTLQCCPAFRKKKTALRIADILSASGQSPLTILAPNRFGGVRAARSGGQDVRDPSAVCLILDRNH